MALQWDMHDTNGNLWVSNGIPGSAVINLMTPVYPNGEHPFGELLDSNFELINLMAHSLEWPSNSFLTVLSFSFVVLDGMLHARETKPGNRFGHQIILLALSVLLLLNLQVSSATHRPLVGRWIHRSTQVRACAGRAGAGE